MNELMIVASLLFIFFSLGWYHSFREKKYAWIDFYWVASFLIVVICLQLFGDEAFAQKKLLLLSLLFIIWSFRLGFHLFRRIRQHSEDPRYIKLKKYWGKSSDRNFFLLFLGEGLLVLILSLPLYMVFYTRDNSVTSLNVLGAILFFLAISGEVIADSQLKKFKLKNAGQKRVCNVGLWKYSRHPNYFFEILIWFSYGVFTVDISLWGFLPGFVMAILIWKVTGVPPAEEQALASRGDLYRKYQLQTSVLIPWPPKKRGIQ